MAEIHYTVTAGANDGYANAPDACSPYFVTGSTLINIFGSDVSAEEFLRAGFTLDGGGITGHVMSIILQIHYVAPSGMSLATVQAILNSEDHRLLAKFYGGDSIEALENPYGLWEDNAGQNNQVLNAWTVHEEIAVNASSAYRATHKLDASLLADAEFGPNNELTLLLIKNVEVYDESSTALWAYDQDPALAVNLTVRTVPVRPPVLPAPGGVIPQTFGLVFPTTN